MFQEQNGQDHNILATTVNTECWKQLNKLDCLSLPGNETISFLISSPTVDSNVDALLSFASRAGPTKNLGCWIWSWKLHEEQFSYKKCQRFNITEKNNTYHYRRE